jgi:hypothetical protein
MEAAKAASAPWLRHQEAINENGMTVRMRTCVASAKEIQL